MIARRSSGRALSTASSWPCPTITCCWRPMPVSESSSWMSSSRHGAPLIMYSDSPVRNSVRVIVTSENSIGSRCAVLSIVSDTSARPSAGRSAVPAKMTSSILPPRSARAPWAPSTHATASTMFDLPEPLGPTTTHTPGSNSSVVLSAKDLKPFSVNDLGTSRPPLRRPMVGARPPSWIVDLDRHRRDEPLSGRGSAARRGRRSARPRRRRPARAAGPRHHATMRSTAAARVLELGLDRAVAAVADPAADASAPRACSRHESRNHTPCTRPVTTTRTPRRAAVGQT